ncbi:MAG: hypothetical protein FWG54_05575 [Bacteroidetes bacterium]|nr:hypothetical protein [Bacteroidota bacterium]
MMNTHKTPFFIAASILCATVTYAQNSTINPKVEVQRDYEGQIMEASKPKLPPVIPDSIGQFNLTMGYSIFEKPYRDLYAFTPLPFVRLRPAGVSKHPWVLMRIGATYPLSPEGALWIQAPLDRASSLQFTAEHQSFWDRLPLVYQERKAVADQSRSNMGLHYALNWDKGNFEIGGDFHRHRYTYFGVAPLLPSAFNPQKLNSRDFMRDSLSHLYNLYKVNMILSSPKTTKEGAIWEILLGWNMIEGETHLWQLSKAPARRENLLTFQANAGVRFLEHHTAGLRVMGDFSNDITGTELDRGVISLNPYYQINAKRFGVNAGIVMTDILNYQEPNTSKRNKVFLYPKISASFQLIAQRLEVYADLRGEGRLNSYQSLMAENPWIAPNLDLRSSHIPWIFQAGFKGKAGERMGLHLYGRYTLTKNQYYFVNTSYKQFVTDNPEAFIYLDNLFALTYDTEEQLTVGAALSWESRAVCLKLRGDYHHYSLSTDTPAWHKPDVELSLTAHYQWRERILATVSAAYRGSVSAAALPALSARGYLYDGYSQIDGFADLGIMLEYRFASWFGLYVEGKNLFNSDQQYYLLYREPGIRIGGGITIRF